MKEESDDFICGGKDTTYPNLISKVKKLKEKRGKKKVCGNCMHYEIKDGEGVCCEYLIKDKQDCCRHFKKVDET